MNAYQVVFLLLATQMTICKTEDDYYDQDPERRECGQYGFRCLDDKTLEFCPISVDGVTEKTVIYECEDDYTCDEDNPAYCTPKEPPNKYIQEAAKSEDTHGNVNDLPFNAKSNYRLERVPRHSRDDECCVEETTTEQLTTTTEEDESEFTTVVFTPAPPFECETYGFFADKKNVSLFWYCDVPPSGTGFLLRHMVCGRGRHFDELLKNCILEGTIRQQRKDCAAKANKNGTKSPERFVSCMDKKPGKYPDEKNCRVYHLCLPKQFSPAIQLSFMCPRGTAYDATCQSCTIAAFNRCQSKQKPPIKGQINCKSPTRFRSIEDCSSYFLCFVDNVIEIKCPKFYKFDDLALECLPEKVAECKEYST